MRRQGGRLGRHPRGWWGREPGRRPDFPSRQGGYRTSIICLYIEWQNQIIMIVLAFALIVHNDTVKWRLHINMPCRIIMSGKKNTRMDCTALVQQSICSLRKFYVWSQQFSKCSFPPWSPLGIPKHHCIIEKAILCPCLYVKISSDTHKHTHTDTYLHICYKLILSHFSDISNNSILS